MEERNLKTYNLQIESKIKSDNSNPNDSKTNSESILNVAGEQYEYINRIIQNKMELGLLEIAKAGSKFIALLIQLLFVALVSFCLFFSLSALFILAVKQLTNSIIIGLICYSLFLIILLSLFQSFNKSLVQTHIDNLIFKKFFKSE